MPGTNTNMDGLSQEARGPEVGAPDATSAEMAGLAEANARLRAQRNAAWRVLAYIERNDDRSCRWWVLIGPLMFDHPSHQDTAKLTMRAGLDALLGDLNQPAPPEARYDPEIDT